jgi:hypothetical protein
MSCKKENVQMGINIFKDSFLKVELFFLFKFHQGESPVEDECKSIFWDFQKIKKPFCVERKFQNHIRST